MLISLLIIAVLAVFTVQGVAGRLYLGGGNIGAGAKGQQQAFIGQGVIKQGDVELAAGRLAPQIIRAKAGKSQKTGHVLRRGGHPGEQGNGGFLRLLC